MRDAGPEYPEVIDSLVQASYSVMALLTQAAAEHDLSVTQLRVLAILRDREPKMAELAAFLGLEKSSVSGLIDRAVRRGLVRRETSNDDGRAVRISLAPAGRRLVDPLTEQIVGLLAPMTARLSASEQRRLHQLLKKVLA